MVQGSTQSQIQQGDLGLDGHEHVHQFPSCGFDLALGFAILAPTHTNGMKKNYLVHRFKMF